MVTGVLFWRTGRNLQPRRTVRGDGNAPIASGKSVLPTIHRAVQVYPQDILQLEDRDKNADMDCCGFRD